MVRNADVRSFLPGLYAVAAFLVVGPAIDLVSAFPVRPLEASWRFGSLGIGFSAVILQLLGLALAMTVAVTLGHRLLLRLLSAFALVGALLLGASIVRFLLDYAQVRAVVDAGSRTGFDATSLRALLVATLAVPVLIVLGGKGWIAGRDALPAATLDRLPELPEQPYVIPFRRRPPTSPQKHTGWR